MCIFVRTRVFLCVRVHLQVMRVYVCMQVQMRLFQNMRESLAVIAIASMLDMCVYTGHLCKPGNMHSVCTWEPSFSRRGQTENSLPKVKICCKGVAKIAIVNTHNMTHNDLLQHVAARCRVFQCAAVFCGAAKQL